MSGEELRGLLKYNNVNLTQLANKCGLKQQTLDSRLKSKSVKADFLDLINEHLDKPLVPVPLESSNIQTKLINDLMEEVKASYESRVKDLSNRIATLENELREKDRRIAELTDELIGRK